jgi:hypothetical protein
MCVVPRRRIDVKLLLASLGIAAGLVLIVLGVRASVTGDEAQNLPDEIEQIDPVRYATQVPQQSSVFVDLITGYEAVLVIDGVELPVVSLDDLDAATDAGGTVAAQGGQQLVLPPGAVFEPGNVTLTFTPGEGQVIETFAPGPHTATVIYWKRDEGRDRARAFTWDFYVV